MFSHRINFFSAAIALVLLLLGIAASVSAIGDEREQMFLRVLQEEDKDLIKMKNGVLVKVLKKGDSSIETGRAPLGSSQVSCFYHGTLPNYKEPKKVGPVFDSAYIRGEPISFAPTDVIICWKDIMPALPVGTEVVLHCPYRTAYGSEGMPPDIPPKSTLRFKMKMVSLEEGERSKSAEEAAITWKQLTGTNWKDTPEVSE